jgi:hypothetical protein
VAAAVTLLSLDSTTVTKPWRIDSRLDALSSTCGRPATAGPDVEMTLEPPALFGEPPP